MKMVFFSSEVSEVELVNREFIQAGIRCEIRHSPNGEAAVPYPACAEVWIQNDEDFHRALLLCVQLGIGFARRSSKKPGFAFDSEVQ
jgi:hypothetical protein